MLPLPAIPSSYSKVAFSPSPLMLWTAWALLCAAVP